MSIQKETQQKVDIQEQQLEATMDEKFKQIQAARGEIEVI